MPRACVCVGGERGGRGGYINSRGADDDDGSNVGRNGSNGGVERLVALVVLLG